MTEHPLDELAAYALGILDADESAQVAAHLGSCKTCRTAAESLAETVWTITEMQARDVPPRVRAAIVERARVDRAARPSLAAFFRRPVPLFVPVALAVLLAVALVGFGNARRDADRYAAVVAQTVGAKVVPLAATGAVGGVRGSLVIPANGAAPYLILDLPPAPAGKTWEAWVIRGDTPVRAGITDERGLTTLTLSAAVASGDTVAVTPEPAGGLDAPTGTPVLAGKS